MWRVSFFFILLLTWRPAAAFDPAVNSCNFSPYKPSYSGDDILDLRRNYHMEK
jgi:hypothetical protein